MKLDKEEKELLESIENDNWKSVDNLKEKIEKFQKVAQNSLKKDKRINIRITERDLMMIQKKAMFEGIPYQTFITSLIHKYISGQLVEVK